MDGFGQSDGFRFEHDSQTFRQCQFASDFHQRRHNPRQRHLADDVAGFDCEWHLYFELLVSAKHERRPVDNPFIRFRYCCHGQSGSVGFEHRTGYSGRTEQRGGFDTAVPVALDQRSAGRQPDWHHQQRWPAHWLAGTLQSQHQHHLA